MSTTPNSVGELLIPLDALLDTRLGTVAKIAGDDAALAVLKAGYKDQAADVFPGIVEDAAFRQAYAERDVQTLKHSVATRWLFDLSGVMLSLREEAAIGPYFSSYQLAVNVYPYQLSETDSVAIRRAVQYWTGPEIRVRLVNLSPKDLTPQYVNHHFVCLVDYDPYTWLNEQAKAFESMRCPDVTFIAPAIYHQAPPSKAALSALDPNVGTPFKSMQFMTKPFVDLALVKPHFFRMISPPAKNSGKQPSAVKMNSTQPV